MKIKKAELLRGASEENKKDNKTLNENKKDEKAWDENKKGRTVERSIG